MGRKAIPIDPDQVFKLAQIGCTNDEIGDILGIDGDRIRVRFKDVLLRARASFKSSLRRAQYKRAVRDRSDSMLIHLGKHNLGQSEVKPDLDINAALDYALDTPAKAGDGSPEVSG